MDFISTILVTLKQPAGFWESILNAFKSATGRYILAVILLAVIIRILFSVVDVVNKKVSAKNANIQAKMQPELDAIKKKYEKDPAVMQQKTSEVYKKYQFSMLGSCLPMLIIMILQMTVFLTLWNSLRAISNYNIVTQYEEMKDIYSTALTLNENEEVFNDLKDGYEISLQVVKIENEKQLKITLTKDSNEKEEYVAIQKLSNPEIYQLIKVNVVETITNENGDEVPSPDYAPADAGVAKKINEAVGKVVKDYYLSTQESFLWIKNIYKAESPTSPLLTEKEMKSYVSPYYTDEEKEQEKEFDYEGNIYLQVTSGIDTKELGANGYYILTIIAVLSSILSLWLSNVLMRNKNAPKQKQPWAMYVIMPLIIGIFTFTYTSLFAIYLIVGQLMMLVLTPLTTLLVKKWNSTEEKKKKDKNVVEVDYRRKDV